MSLKSSLTLAASLSLAACAHQPQPENPRPTFATAGPTDMPPLKETVKEINPDFDEQYLALALSLDGNMRQKHIAFLTCEKAIATGVRFEDEIDFTMAKVPELDCNTLQNVTRNYSIIKEICEDAILDENDKMTYYPTQIQSNSSIATSVGKGITEINDMITDKAPQCFQTNK